MSKLQHLIDHLTETELAVGHLRAAVDAQPDDEVLRSNLVSIVKRQEDLTRRLDYTLNAKQTEFVRYRIMRDWTSQYSVASVAKSLLAFQELVTAIFDAIRTNPKQRYRPTAENVELSTFEFVGATAGSVLVSLALPEDRLLLGKSDVDLTFGYVERTLSARTSEDLLELASEVGVAAITKAYNWAETNSSQGVSSQITWGKTFADYQEISISLEEVETIRDLIADKSDEATSTEIFDCKLLGFDGSTSYFHIETVNEQIDIRGNLGPGLSKSWTTGLFYRAKVMKTAQVRYATGEERVQWTLLDLQPLTSDPKALITDSDY